MRLRNRDHRPEHMDESCAESVGNRIIGDFEGEDFEMKEGGGNVALASNMTGNKKWKFREGDEFRVRAKHGQVILPGKKCWVELKEPEDVHKGGFNLAKGWENQRIVYLGIWSKINHKKVKCVKILVHNDSSNIFQIGKGQRVGWTRPRENSE